MVAVVLVIGGVMVASWAVVASGSETASPEASSEPVSPAFGTEPITTIGTIPTRPHPAAGAPREVSVPSMGIAVPVIGLDVLDGVLTPPDDPQVLGWWRDGARPGAVSGGALVTGHTVSTGGGALDDLEDVRSGATVQVRTNRGVIDYRVSQVEIYRKATLAKNAQRVFSQTGPGKLVLITCEDWDGEIYRSNVVVYADPVTES